MENLEKLTKKELLERLKEAENRVVPSGAVHYSDSETELAKIDKLAVASNPYGIPFRETSDHKNIMLYTAINKRVGPLHPDNARRTMVRWKRAGVQLYTKKRTDAEVEAFKQTIEYKNYMIKHEATRKLRHQQSSKGKVNKMVEDVAKATATAVAEAMKK